jgi:nucleoside-diphosphate-sugar epimerase
VKYYIIGSTGRLGRALAAEYSSSHIVELERSAYEDWVKQNASDRITRYFENHSDGPACIFIAAGLLDPAAPELELRKINYELPVNVITGAARLDIPVITFGTVMERTSSVTNTYVQSKKALGDFVLDAIDSNVRAMHLQIHTLFGVGLPSPFMFLGQMLASIKANRPFRMTSGKQLREYHHLSDETKAIRIMEQSTCVGVHDVSHGQPVSLRDIAESVFGALGKEELLEIGAIESPLGEIYSPGFEKSAVLNPVTFRNTIPAIIEYMKICLACSGDTSSRSDI